MNKGSIQIRLTNQDDIMSVIGVEEACYEPKLRVTADVMNSRFKKAPNSFWVAVCDGQVVGYLTGIKIDFDPANLPSSRAKALCYTEPNPATFTDMSSVGNALYVASIGVHPNYANRGIGTALIKISQKYVKDNGLLYRVAGLRIAGYDEYYNNHHAIPAEDYAILQHNGQTIEPWIRLYKRLGFKILAIKKDYYPIDKASQGYGALMIWTPN